MLKTCLKFCLLLAVLGLLPSVGQAQSTRQFKTNLIGYEEVPAISTTGAGAFEMLIDFGDTGFSYELSYSGLTGNVLQAHIHIAQKGVNGGIMIFFCTNLGNGPAGTQPCPAPSGTVSGFVTAADVIGGAAAQGVSPGEFAEVLKAIRAGSAYANVHSSLFPGGEIRGQVVPVSK
ncbi:MAG TPA: CHRD domain-containing protein [Blastocatellia bacterium]|nr:CHRD domain-containing protein [Blastocatellia bacterium]